MAFVTIAGITPAQSSGLTPTEQAEAFATCAGRMQALATRQGAIRDPQFEATRRMQSDFESLMDATLLDAQRETGQAKRWQAYGWVEIASLLRNEQYSTDATGVARARADRARRIGTCERMILPG